MLPHGFIVRPHPKEMARLTGQKRDGVMQSPADSASVLAAQTLCIVVLQALGTTILAADGRMAQNLAAQTAFVAHRATGAKAAESFGYAEIMAYDLARAIGDVRVRCGR